MAELKHRIADTDDLDVLAEWNHQLIEDEGSRNSMSVAELRARLADWLETSDYCAVLFYNQQLPVAYALYAEKEDEIFLRQFFVAREHRRRGHGREAMNILRTKLWSAEKFLTVDVLTHNTSAYSFWRECGYVADYIHMRREGIVGGHAEASQ